MSCLAVRFCVVLLAAAAVLLFGCEDNDDKSTVTAPPSRAQAIQGGPTEASDPREASVPANSARAPAKARVLCPNGLESPGRSLPSSDIFHAEAPGATALDEALPVAGGKWTWINFWAAWCVPCKEEIPRLLGWEKKLNAQGKGFRVVFITLDDDARQLRDFLTSQPDTGLKRTYWLREGEEREKWLGAVSIEPDPELPQHLLVDPAGKLRCVVNGAVEDADFERVLALVSG